LVAPTDSKDPVLDLEAHSKIYLDQNEELMSSVSDSEKLDADRQAGALVEQPS